MKKRWLISLAAIAMLGSSGMVYSYFQDQDSQDNVLLIGENVIEIEEEVEYPEELVPGTTFLKQPTIANTGDVDCYVRVWIGFQDDSFVNMVSMDINTDDWQLSEDGYYYYQSVLAAGESTTPLFTTVSLLDTYNEEDFDIIVYSESVQAETFDDCYEAFAAIDKEAGS